MTDAVDDRVKNALGGYTDVRTTGTQVARSLRTDMCNESSKLVTFLDVTLCTAIEDGSQSLAVSRFPLKIVQTGGLQDFLSDFIVRADLYRRRYDDKAGFAH